MEFSCETYYDGKKMSAMARALRKTVRRKKSLRSHIFGWCIVLLSLPLLFWTKESGFSFQIQPRTIFTLLVLLILLSVLLWEDRINGYVARKRMPPGTQKTHVVFKETEFVSSTELGTSSFRYDKIRFIAEDADCFVFLFSQSHAQVYDKKGITGATPEQMRSFLEAATGITVQKI